MSCVKSKKRKREREKGKRERRNEKECKRKRESKRERAMDIVVGANVRHRFRHMGSCFVKTKTKQVA